MTDNPTPRPRVDRFIFFAPRASAVVHAGGQWSCISLRSRADVIRSAARGAAAAAIKPSRAAADK